MFLPATCSNLVKFSVESNIPSVLEVGKKSEKEEQDAGEGKEGGREEVCVDEELHVDHGRKVMS